jgi:hypothetical protein
MLSVSRSSNYHLRALVLAPSYSDLLIIVLSSEILQDKLHDLTTISLALHGNYSSPQYNVLIGMGNIDVAGLNQGTIVNYKH